jgi:predicted transcriptional regulator
MPQAKKEQDENKVLIPLYREYPGGLSTGELSEFLGVSRITGRKYLIELKQAGKIKETGTTNRHIEGEPVSRAKKGYSNYNEWILTEKQYNKMHNELFSEERFEAFAHFLVQTMFGNPVEAPEQIDALVSHGYVFTKKGKMTLTKKGIEKVVELLQDSETDGG